ncbi:MAG: LacI family DNA-binding transcriptional regulator [Betaproteobacteria bacterium]|nr:MAG: LacI family DNA-binding transcriptional regulator [Betaproteobacteria bacterium]
MATPNPAGRTRKPRAETMTLRDVARAAGASTASASRALTGEGSVTTELRSRILAAAARLGYVCRYPDRVREPARPLRLRGYAYNDRRAARAEPAGDARSPGARCAGSGLCRGRRIDRDRPGTGGSWCAVGQPRRERGSGGRPQLKHRPPRRGRFGRALSAQPRAPPRRGNSPARRRCR